MKKVKGFTLVELLIVIAIIGIICAVVLPQIGCIPTESKPAATKNAQAEKAKAAANSIQFTENAEIDNIRNRLELTANPGLLGFVVLLNETGQPVMSVAVKGKITSGSKRLTDPKTIVKTSNGNMGDNMAVTDSPSDEGTFGSSGEYIFFWTTAGQYIQWNGKYLYSDKPFRLSVEPIVVSQQ